MASNHNTYELTYIVNSVISDNQIQDLIKRVTTYVTENGGEVIEVDQWGSRRLAFPIMKKRNGFYVNMYFRASGSIIQRLERALEIDDNVLRYLTMKMDAKMLRHFTEQKAVRTTFAPVEDKPKSDSRSRAGKGSSDTKKSTSAADSKTDDSGADTPKSDAAKSDADESKPETESTPVISAGTATDAAPEPETAEADAEAATIEAAKTDNTATDAAGAEDAVKDESTEKESTDAASTSDTGDSVESDSVDGAKKEEVTGSETTDSASEEASDGADSTDDETTKTKAEGAEA